MTSRASPGTAFLPADSTAVLLSAAQAAQLPELVEAGEAFSDVQQHSWIKWRVVYREVGQPFQYRMFRATFSIGVRMIFL